MNNQIPYQFMPGPNTNMGPGQGWQNNPNFGGNPNFPGWNPNNQQQNCNCREQLNQLENRLNRMERQIRRIDNRLSRLEGGYPVPLTANASNEADFNTYPANNSSMYMM